MHGSDVGTLKVTQGSDLSKIVLLEKTGSQGNQWKEYLLPLDHVVQPYQISITYERGFGPFGDVAVDNVMVQPGLCPQPNNVISFCEFDVPCSEATNVTGTCPAIPAMDASAGFPNVFMNWDSNRCNNQNAAINYNVKSGYRGSCLHFHYKIKQSQKCKFNVFRTYRKSGKLRTSRIFFRTDGSENTWLPVKISIVPRTEKIQLKLKISSKCQYFAVDDFEVTDGLC